MGDKKQRPRSGTSGAIGQTKPCLLGLRIWIGRLEPGERGGSVAALRLSQWSRSSHCSMASGIPPGSGGKTDRTPDLTVKPHVRFAYRTGLAT